MSQTAEYPAAVAAPSTRRTERVSATKAVENLSAKVSSSQKMLFHGQRLALLGGMSSVMAQLIAEEESERKAIMTDFEIGASEETKPFEPKRVSRNKLETEERDARAEIQYEEFAVQKQMWDLFLQETRKAMHDQLASEAAARDQIDREATYGVLKIVAEFTVNHDALYKLFRTELQKTTKIYEQRKGVFDLEDVARQAYSRNEDIKFKELMRRAQSRAAELLPIQKAHLEKLKLAALEAERMRQRQIEEEARLTQLAVEAERRKAVEDAAVTSMQHVESEERGAFDNIVRLEKVKRLTL